VIDFSSTLIILKPSSFKFALVFRWMDDGRRIFFSPASRVNPGSLLPGSEQTINFRFPSGDSRIISLLKVHLTSRQVKRIHSIENSFVFINKFF